VSCAAAFPAWEVIVALNVGINSFHLPAFVPAVFSNNQASETISFMLVADTEMNVIKLMVINFGHCYGTVGETKI
jgi:hypothetical protein